MCSMVAGTFLHSRRKVRSPELLRLLGHNILAEDLSFVKRALASSSVPEDAKLTESRDGLLGPNDLAKDLSFVKRALASSSDEGAKATDSEVQQELAFAGGCGMLRGCAVTFVSANRTHLTAPLR